MDKREKGGGGGIRSVGVKQNEEWKKREVEEEKSYVSSDGIVEVVLKSSIRKKMTPPYPPSLYPCSSSLFLIWHLPSPLAPRPLPSSFISVHPSFSYFSLSSSSTFSYSVSSFSSFSFFYYYFPSHLAPSLYSLLPSLFFIPSDSYHFSFFLLILLPSPFPTPFFPHSLHHCLQLLSSLFEFSSFFSSSFSPSLLRCPSPFPHHSL